jgi:hypothetical protein
MKANVDDIFAYNIALYVIGDIDDRGLKSIKDYRCLKYLPMKRDYFNEIKLAL